MKLGALVVVLAALCVVHVRDYRSSQALAGAALAANHKSAVAETLLAETALDEKKYDEVISHCDAVLDRQPDSPLALVIKGTALLRSGQYKQAEVPLQKAADLAAVQRLSMATNAKYALAECQIDLGKTEEAQKVAYSALVDDPNSGRAVYLLGLLARADKHDENATLFLRRAFSMGYDDALIPLTELYLEKRNFPIAYRCGREALKRLGTSAARVDFGQAALGYGDLPAAQSELMTALRAQPHNARVMALLSLLYERKGDQALAKSYHEDALKIDSHVFDGLDLTPAVQATPAPLKGAAQ